MVNAAVEHRVLKIVKPFDRAQDRLWGIHVCFRSLRSGNYFGAGLELPMSTTTFQYPSFCFFQMDVYLP